MQNMLCSCNTGNVNLIWETIGKIIPWICAVASVIISAYTAMNSQRATKFAVLKEKCQNEIITLQSQLESFYYPFILRSGTNKKLYNLFALNEKERDSNFSTVTYIRSGNCFSSQTDTFLFKRIVENDQELYNLIVTQGKVVGDEQLREKLEEASAHYSVMMLLAERYQDGTEIVFPNEYDKYRFPRDLDSAIISKARDIEERINGLKSKLESY